jgi:hypothetical protein
MSDPRFGRDDEPMPAWRGRSTMAVSLGVHAAAVLAWLTVAALPPVITVPAAAPMREVARIELPPRDEPFAIDAPIPPEQLSGYDISGLPFNLPKIAARRASLFPFLTADLTFIDRLAGDVRAAAAHLANPLDRALAAKPLELDDRLLQQIVDESWSRRDRWRRFQQVASLLIGHDGHDGRAPALLRGYLDQNLLQPYCDGKIKDGQFWAMVENAADHADFLEFIRMYARTRSSSRTTTELLFLMDELAQGNREVAITVMTTNVGRDLVYTAVQSPRAALLAADLQNDLNRWFAARGTSARDSLRDAYDRLRLRILATIVETSPGGYRVADARFLAGEIFYRQGDTDQALDWWEEMSPAPGDTYRGAATAIVESITGAGPIDHPGLRRIIAGESSRWREVNYARLKQFGYRCDSY